LNLLQSINRIKFYVLYFLNLSLIVFNFFLRIIEIHVPSKNSKTSSLEQNRRDYHQIRNVFSFKFKDSISQRQWFTKLQNVQEKISNQIIRDTNSTFKSFNQQSILRNEDEHNYYINKYQHHFIQDDTDKTKIKTLQLKQIGWLDEQILNNTATQSSIQPNSSKSSTLHSSQILSGTFNSLNSSSSLSISNQNINTGGNTLKNKFQTKPMFLALTKDLILFYDQVPQSIDDWLHPVFSYSLLVTRLIIGKSNNSNGSNTTLISNEAMSDTNNNLLLTRHGTTRGVVSHLFRCMSKSSMEKWSKSIEKQTFSAVTSAKQVDFCKLIFVLK
jgi:hypothetical protein